MVFILELEEATKEYNKIKSKVDNLTKKIEEITEGEPKEAKRLLDEATNMLEKTHSGINQANVDIKAAERQVFILNYTNVYMLNYIWELSSIYLHLILYLSLLWKVMYSFTYYLWPN